MEKEVSEKWGTDVKTAVDLALADLKLTIDEVDVTVLEEPSRGFFGIGSKLALVRVEKKKPVKEKPVEEPAVSRASVQKNEKPAVKAEAEPVIKEKKADAAAAAPKSEVAKKLQSEVLTDDMVDTEDHIALSFLREVAEQMGLDIEMTAKANDTNVFVDIHGKDSGTIIGKRGQTLDAIQYLTSLVVNKGQDDYIRVVVDAENYRAKREVTLENLANRLAGKVIRTKRSVKLEPMNPYERKVIHSTLQDNSRVRTRSEGQEPYRRVIIELK